REEEIGDVGTRDGKDQANQREEYIERLRVAAAQAVQTTGAVSNHQFRRGFKGTMPGVDGVTPGGELATDGSLRLPGGNARPQSCHGDHPVISCVREESGRIAPAFCLQK